MRRGCEDDMFKTISSTEGTRRNVKKCFERLVLIGVLERENKPEWGAPYFAKPKPEKH